MKKWIHAAEILFMQQFLSQIFLSWFLAKSANGFHPMEAPTLGGVPFITKYGVQMNISEELRDELEWHPTSNFGREKRSVLQRRMYQDSESEEDEEPQCSDDARILGHLLDGYDPLRIPGGGNVKVSVEIWVQEVSKIMEVTSEFELDIYVTEFWNDPSLAFEHLNPCKHNISVDGKFFERFLTVNHTSFSGGKLIRKIWNPLGCFVNSKDAGVHWSPFSNIFLQLYSNGSVWHNYRIKLTGPCINTFRTFPIDQQKCMLFYESYNHNYEQVRMEWSDTPIVLLKENITLPDYVLVDFKASSIRRIYPPGLWNELIATFTFQRLYGFYILQVYIPAYISVFMSWISFYIGNNIPSRTIIGVNSLLSLTYQLGSIVVNLPKTSDVKAIDVMILITMGFIFSSLIELAFVGFLLSNNSTTLFENPIELAKRIDKASSIGFPVCFVIFNLWYWFIFMKPG